MSEATRRVDLSINFKYSPVAIDPPSGAGTVALDPDPPDVLRAVSLSPT